MNLLDLLQQRNSCASLTAPGPDPEQLQAMVAAALRAPDHAWLRPWRFLVIEGQQREQLGELFAHAAELRGGPLAPEELARSRQLPMRAPMLLVVIARIQDHPKVPEQEQWLSAGCAAHAVLLAAEASGFAGIWRTGINASDSTVKAGLGLAGNEHIVGFLYLGTPAGPRKKLPSLPVEDFLTRWE